ncbi:MAG: GAF domain-containing protein [Deltaproteobacteria bacterium]|nr:GAF domain-containing protein [Deltaproteobacteria bacterium]
MLFKSIFGQSSGGGDINNGGDEGMGLRPDIKALAQISADINAQKELDLILEMVARESLTSLQAHRSTIFITDEKTNGVLKTQFTFASDPLNEQVGLFEEKDVTRKVLKQKKPFWLKEPKDFSEFFKYEARERKITSLISIPLMLQGKATGTISVVVINGGKKFDKGSLQLLSIFANQISMAMENAYLRQEIHKGINFRKDYERYLDDILVQLQRLSEGEQRRIEEHIGSLFKTEKTDDKKSVEPPVEEKVDKVDGSVDLTGELGIDCQQEEPVDEILRVAIDDGSLSMADDLINGGVFIRTPNPLDLGEQFPMKLYLSRGEMPIEVNCKVIWSNQYGHETKDLRRGMGVKFINLDPEIQKRIEESLRAQRHKWNESPAMEKSV